MELSEYKKKFEYMEKEYDLFYMKYNNIFWWDLVRYQIFFLLYDEVSGIKSISVKKKNMRLSSTYFKLLFNEIKYRYFFNSKQCDYLFYVSSREKDSKGYTIDNVAKNILNLYRRKSLILESFASIEHPSNYNSYYNFGLRIKILINRRKKIRIENSLNQIIKNVFNIELNLDSIINENIKKFIIEGAYYKKFLKDKNPKLIFMVQNGIQKGLISASNELKIPIIELQHGLINQFHPAYNYSKDINYDHLTTFPNYLFSFSEYWHNIYLPKTMKIKIGNDTNYINETAHDNKIGIVFANKYAKILIELTKELAVKYPDKEFVVKLHPNQGNEVDYIKEVFAAYSNIEVIYNEKNIKDILINIESIILVQSTVIYQALQNGCKAYIYKRQDYEIHQDLFNNKNVYLFDNISEIAVVIDKEFKKESNVFFNKFDRDLLIEVVNSIENNNKKLQ
jgi:hypothetical protein